MIYGGCQKNLGPAGATFVIIRNDYLDKVVADRKIPTMLKYQTHVITDLCSIPLLVSISLPLVRP